MAKIIPAGWPNPTAAVDYAAHTVYTDEDTRRIVESHNFMLAHQMRGHVGQYWPAGMIQDATGGTVAKLSYLVTPRALASEIRLWAILDSTNGGTLRLDCTEAATFVALPVAAGAGVYVTGTLTVSRPTLLSTIVVSLAAASGADTIDLRALSLSDESLAALP